MFCPRCSTENLESQKYCRKCGLSLSNILLVLSGSMDEITEKVKKGEGVLAGGAINLLIFSFIALLNIFFSNGRSWGGAINLILGMLIAAPMIYLGVKRLECARRLIEGDTKSEPVANKQVKELPTAPTTDRTLSMPESPMSITEHTTYELTPPDEPSNRRMQSQ
jgi:hypothetical protein